MQLPRGETRAGSVTMQGPILRAAAGDGLPSQEIVRHERSSDGSETTNEFFLLPVADVTDPAAWRKRRRVVGGICDCGFLVRADAADHDADDADDDDLHKWFWCAHPGYRTD